jgi:CarD family transcriptional regulator
MRSVSESPPAFGGRFLVARASACPGTGWLCIVDADPPDKGLKPGDPPRITGFGAAFKAAQCSGGASRMTTAKKTTAGRQGFKTGEAVVYPAHGVGRITAIEEQEIAGYKLELFVVSFEKDKMVLRVPTAKANSVGMRKLAEPELVKKALDLLTGRARVKRTMWSRRAQEYEAKINSGDLLSVTEVVRDLYRSEAQPEQSYSERQLYESALDRVVREISSVNRITETEALKLIEQSLAKSPRRAKGEAEAEGEAESDDLQEEAA